MFSRNFLELSADSRRSVSIEGEVMLSARDILDLMIAAIASGFAVFVLFPIYLGAAAAKAIVRRCKSTPASREYQADL